MVTVNNVYFPSGYSSVEHLLPDASNVFADIIGASFKTVREVKNAALRVSRQHHWKGANLKVLSASFISARAEVVMANGDKIIVTV